ncbi:MAG TPA: hypothetical protein VGL77_20595, partial [Armatimonadota bacterium]
CTVWATNTDPVSNYAAWHVGDSSYNKPIQTWTDSAAVIDLKTLTRLAFTADCWDWDGTRHASTGLAFVKIVAW